MSNKSKSRKKREKAMFDFLIAITRVAVSAKVAAHKIQEIKYPKLATGVLVWESRPIQPLIERKFHMNIENTLPEVIIKDAKTIKEARMNFIKTGVECI
jgi:hypothetical protein